MTSQSWWPGHDHESMNWSLDTAGLGSSFKTVTLNHSWLDYPCYLLLGKEVLDQGTHDLLWGPGCADVGDDGIPMSLLSIADPA